MKQLWTSGCCSEVLTALGLDVVHIHFADRLDALDLNVL